MEEAGQAGQGAFRLLTRGEGSKFLDSEYTVSNTRVNATLDRSFFLTLLRVI